ncbi:50S ribosome-binding GTPase [bacterium]|nr:50S ribosome-binding GTPase [bacterium]
MPANLTPQYLEAEQAFKDATTDEERVRRLEEMLRLIPKHKGTERMQADLKHKLSRLRQQQEEAAARGRKSFSFKVRKEGAGQIALAGPANIGKSSLVAALTNATPEVADYPFTTRAPQAAMMQFEDVRIQLVDMPPLSEEYEEHWVVDLLKAADVVLLCLDLAGDPLSQSGWCLEHMAAKKLVPLRGSESDPQVLARPMLAAGLRLDAPGARETLEIFRELDESGLALHPLSAETGEGVDNLRRALFDSLNVIRVYPKAPGGKPDLAEPFVLPAGSTVLQFAEAVHRDIAASLKFARIWSKGKYEGQMVNREERLADGDILELHS